MKSVKQADQPLTLRGRQDIALSQDVPDLIQLEQKLLAHDLQRADLPSVLLLREVDLTITSLTDLGENLKVTVPQPGSSATQLCSFATKVLLQIGLIFFGVHRRWQRVVFLECVHAPLSGVNIAEKVVVVVEEV